jgi:hypothetical protein
MGALWVEKWGGKEGLLKCGVGVKRSPLLQKNGRKRVH